MSRREHLNAVACLDFRVFCYFTIRTMHLKRSATNVFIAFTWLWLGPAHSAGYLFDKKIRANCQEQNASISHVRIGRMKEFTKLGQSRAQHSQIANTYFSIQIDSNCIYGTITAIVCTDRKLWTSKRHTRHTIFVSFLFSAPSHLHTHATGIEDFDKV